ncbi:hypothetical protein Salat_0293000 [Sesamum alatum]|uniref:RNase H type-1 domain-containing protein n=1 Tax=Sesamum alatum TaxID=300844 RepID=A0AAE2CYS0_9LAMI|nr:hypothetical protein Salat_0293000 [Sesamum alatum]
MRRFQHAEDPLLAEILAAREAIRLGAAEGWQHVIVEWDSKTVIDRLNSSSADNSVIGPIVEEIQAMRRSFCYCQFSHVPREANFHADRLARAAVTDAEGRNAFPSLLL